MPAEAPRPERDEAFLHNAAQIADQFDREEQPLHAATVRFILARFAQAERRAEEMHRRAQRAEATRDHARWTLDQISQYDRASGGYAAPTIARHCRDWMDRRAAALTAAAKGTGD